LLVLCFANIVPLGTLCPHLFSSIVGRSVAVDLFTKGAPSIRPTTFVPGPSPPGGPVPFAIGRPGLVARPFAFPVFYVARSGGKVTNENLRPTVRRPVPSSSCCFSFYIDAPGPASSAAGESTARWIFEGAWKVAAGGTREFSARAEGTLDRRGAPGRPIITGRGGVAMFGNKVDLGDKVDKVEGEARALGGRKIHESPIGILASGMCGAVFGGRADADLWNAASGFPRREGRTLFRLIGPEFRPVRPRGRVFFVRKPPAKALGEKRPPTRGGHFIKAKTERRRRENPRARPKTPSVASKVSQLEMRLPCPPRTERRRASTRLTTPSLENAGSA